MIRRSSALYWLALAAVLLGLTPAAATPTLARDVGWSEGAQVSPGGPTYEPRVAYDQQGFAHTVYFGGETQADWEVFYSNNRRGTWAAPRQISSGGEAENRNPDIAVSADGHVHVVYEQRSRRGGQVAYVESPDFGSTWGQPVNVSNTDGRAYEPAVAVDANNAVHVGWIDSRWADVLQATYSWRPAGGGFAAPIKIGGNQFEQSVDLTTTGSGGNVIVHAVYQGRKSSSNSQNDYDVWYVSGTAGTFNAPRNLSNDSGEWSLEPSITSNGVSDLYIAWDTEGNYHDVVLIRSTNAGGSWTRPQNVASRSTPALTPALSYGLLNGAPHIHLAWSEGDTGKRSIFYLAYSPASNTFSTQVEQASDSGTLSVDIAGSLASSVVAVSYRDRNLLSKVSTRGSGPAPAPTTPPTQTPVPTPQPLEAGIRFGDGADAFNTNTLPVTLSDVRGGPAEMRYSFDRLPDDRDAWQPFEASFSVRVPAESVCQRTFVVQLRASDGRVSSPFSRPVRIDTSVQANVTFQGLRPDLSLDPGYTRGTSMVAGIQNSDCSGLRRMFIGSDPTAIEISSTTSFTRELPLADTQSEGPRELRLRLQDTLGNESTITRTVVIDRTPPQLVSGTLTISAPVQGLPSVLATLEFSGVNVRDDRYPGGRWGAMIANQAAGPASQADSGDLLLAWRYVPITTSGDRFVIRNWSVLSSLAAGVGDRSLAGQEVVVRVKFVDGAGNPTNETLTAVVRLATNFQPVSNRLPLVIR